MSMLPAIVPIEVTEHTVLAKCDFFSESQIWPLRRKLNPKKWLANFEADELEHALYLLNAFIYISSEVSNELFRAAFHNICNRLYSISPEIDIREEWANFVSGVHFTHVTGEMPSVTDSGLTYARRTKQLLGVPESHIMDNSDLLREIYVTPKDVVFVDDFVGSGNQFKRTWTRKHRVGSERISFSELANNGYSKSFFYIPLVSTKHGFDRITEKCSGVHLLPAHIISEQYGVFNLMSRAVWPEHLRPSSLEFIRRASERAGIDMSDPESWMGFHRLGLTLAFEDSIPDATLPLFSWDQNGWHPLVRIV